MDRYTRRVFRDASLPAKHIFIFRTLWFGQNEAKFANLFKGRLASSLTLWATGLGRAN